MFTFLLSYNEYFEHLENFFGLINLAFYDKVLNC